ncbi:UPF0764 protein C16orf89-like protein [Trichoplax sp. H2]|nr:UPF0764 protein C16orf89-like protein [Trichoplax sp. H2]|eukprot:RDD38410.1 UPF0764 protein C16orf89-like protein [Trichoplax sp. H2]
MAHIFQASLTILIFITKLYFVTNQEYSYPTVTVDDLIESWRGIISFYTKNRDKIIMDSIYGLYTSKEYVKVTLKEADEGKSILTEEQITRLRELFTTADKVIEDITSKLKKADPTYKAFSKMFENSIPIPHQLIELNYHQNIAHKIDRNQIKSMDRYMLDIMGVKEHPICTFTDECIDFIRSLNSNDYTLTHQVLAMLLAKQFGCITILDKKLQKYGGLLKLQHQLCSRIWDGMIENLKEGLSKQIKQDLFLEQIYTCAGVPGFQQFINQTFIAMILKWQSQDGCFRYYRGPYIYLDPNKPNRSFRNPRYGCLQHYTALAAGVISLYLRWFSSRSFKLSEDSLNLPTQHSLGNLKSNIAFICLSISITLGLALFLMWKFSRNRIINQSRKLFKTI